MRPSIDSNRTTSPVSTTDTDRTPELTPEEQLLADLLAANEELMEALRVYDDLERVGLEREAEERSRKEIRMDRSVRVIFTLFDHRSAQFSVPM